MAGHGSARSRFHRIVVTHCDPATQSWRLRERDQISIEDAELRIAAQLPPGDRLSAADYVVDTSGSPEETRRRAKEVFESLRRDGERRTPGP